MLRKINLSILLKVCIAWFLTLLLVLSLFFFDFFFSFLDSQVGFLFEATFEEFKSWYPNGYFFIFCLFRIFPIPFVFLFSYILIKFFKKNKSLFIQKMKIYYVFNFTIFTIGAFVLLIVYLLIYSFFSLDFFEQLLLTRSFLLAIYIQIVLTCLFNVKAVLSTLKKFLFKPALPYNLAVFRILLFSYFILFYLGNSKTYFNSVATGNYKPLPIFGDLFYFAGSSLFVYKLLFYICLFAFAGVVVGYKTRFFLVISSILSLFVISTPNMFGTSWHHHLFMWIPWFFTFSSCFDVFSIDSYLKNDKSITLKGDYTFTIRIIWLQIGVLYWCAGVNKLWDSGFDWALSESMINQFRLEWFENFSKIPSIRIDKTPVLMHVGGVAAICFEMLFFFLLFKKKNRYIAILGGLIMHNILGYFLHISFFGTLQILYLIFIDWNSLFSTKSVTNHEKETKLEKLNVRAGIFLVSINVFFGFASIQTYPFSGYPEYSDIIPSYTYQLMFHGFNGDVKTFDNSDMKKNNFDWETYRRREQQIANKYLNGEKYKDDILSYWRLICEHISSAKNTEKVEVYLHKVNLDPDQYKVFESRLVAVYEVRSD